MKTERLIDLLGSNVEAARGNQIAAALVTALALGSVAAFCVMLATVGLRPGIADGAHLGFLALKLLFALSLVGIGAVLLAKMMRPGQDGKGLAPYVLVPFAAVIGAGLVTLALNPPGS